MITIKDIRGILNRCLYKPGSEFSCEPVINGLGSLRDIDLMTDTPVMVHITIKVQDVKTLTDTTVRGSFKLERGELEQMDEMMFLERLRKEILRSEEHEIDEWFLVDGNCYKEPHPEMRRKLAWHQKEPNTDLRVRANPRKPKEDPWKMRWPEFAPVSPEAGKMVHPDEVMFIEPMRMPASVREELEQIAQKNRRDLLARMASEMRLDPIMDTSTLMKETMLPGAPNGKRTMPMPPQRPPKKIKLNTTSAMGLKVRPSTKHSQLRSSPKSK